MRILQTLCPLAFGPVESLSTQRYQHLESNDVSRRAMAIFNGQNVERNRAKIKAVHRRVHSDRQELDSDVRRNDAHGAIAELDL